MTKLALAALCFQLMVAGFGLASAQTASDQNAGSVIEVDSQNQIYRFKWWAKLGHTYFLQHSEDLVVWNWVPVVEVGQDAIKEYGFTSTGSKFFVRLKITDARIADPSSDDFDGDGLSNLFEVQWGSDPLDYYSRPGEVITPAISILSGDNQSGPPAQALPDRLTVKVLNAATGEPLDNAPVTFSPNAGGVSRSLARTGTSGRAAVTFTTPDTVGTFSIVASTGAVSVQFSGNTGSTAGQPPNAPTGFTSVSNPDGTKTLSWVDTSNNEQAFAIWTRSANGQWTEIGTVVANQTTATITDEGTLAP